ncbi:diacylglycerol/lipid kinase family protein [Actinomadura kijaniata]|uniref:diacylglycerol/lipid kinase family protein n=1 Tax=Actinomadura kijaniata TaxID=46161 RepID=UPI003F1BF150
MLLITNARAGTSDAETIDRAEAILREAGPVTRVACSEPEDLDRALAGHDDGTVVAAGGDGSIHTLVQALHRRGELDGRVVGLLPLGTGNDLARNMGIPLEATAAARLVAGEGRPRALDLFVDDAGGVVVNAAHVGIGAEAAEAATRFKPLFKTAAFPLGSLLAGLRHTGWRLRVEADGELVTDGTVLMVALGNSSGIAGGNADLAPGASPSDGRLDLVVSAATGPLARVGYALHLRSGRHLRRDDVVRTIAKEVSVSGEPFRVNTDGEVSEPVTSRTWTVLPRAWRLLTP